MSALFYVNLTITLFVGTFALASLLLAPSSRATLQRVQQVTNTVKTTSRTGRQTEQWQQIVGRLAVWIRAHFSLAERDGLGERMLRAGYRGATAIDLYTATRVVGPMVMFVLAFLIPWARVFWMMSLPALAYLAPDLFLQYLIRKRTASIRKSISDVVDLLVICVDAGLGLDQAMLRVAQELSVSHPAMHDEFLQINREQRAGKPRLEAWNAMSARVQLPEIDAFVNMLTQTERFGTPISRALSNFANLTRLRRTQKAEESAAKTTIKIIFPLVLFIFPSIFIVLLGPAAITLMRGFKGNF